MTPKNKVVPKGISGSHESKAAAAKADWSAPPKRNARVVKRTSIAERVHIENMGLTLPDGAWNTLTRSSKGPQLFLVFLSTNF
jgi:hypothetical protein